MEIPNLVKTIFNVCNYHVSLPRHFEFEYIFLSEICKFKFLHLSLHLFLCT